MTILDEIKLSWAAAKLRALAEDPTDLERAFDILGEFDSAQRKVIAARAVEIGADPIAVDTIVKIVEGEVIDVSGKAPRGAKWWALALAATGGLAAGGALYAKRVKV